MALLSLYVRCKCSPGLVLMMCKLAGVVRRMDFFETSNRSGHNFPALAKLDFGVW